MWFEHSEFDARVAAAHRGMVQAGLDYLLLLHPESVTYLTGFFTEGYGTSFQAAILPIDAPPVSIVRIGERYHFDTTAAWTDRLITWSDGEEPAEILLRALRETGVTGRIGFEGRSWRAPYALVAEVTAAREDLSWVDVGDDITRLRFVKSPAEIALHRRAASAVDAMHTAIAAAVAPGVPETELAITASAAGIRAGSDVADPGPIAAGERGRHIHSMFGEGVVAENDLLFLEMDASSRHYRSRSMRTVAVGDVSRRMRDTFARFIEVQDEALSHVRAGASCRAPDEVLRAGVLGTGWVDTYPNKTFYGLGFMLLPTTFELLEVTPRSDFAFQAGMVLHTYIAARGLNISDTILVTDDGYERLTRSDRELVIV